MQIEIGFVLGLTDLQITIVRLETRLNVLAAYARLQNCKSISQRPPRPAKRAGACPSAYAAREQICWCNQAREHIPCWGLQLQHRKAPARLARRWPRGGCYGYALAISPYMPRASRKRYGTVERPRCKQGGARWVRQARLTS
jgi:hypothetical protein